MSFLGLASGTYALTFARVLVGVVMIYYGWPKIKDLQSNARDFEDMGFKPPWLWGTPVAFLEFFGGIFMLIGFYSSFVALFYSGQMAVGAFWKILKTNKRFSDWSYDLLLLALCLLIWSLGPGIYSLTRF